MFVGVSEQIQRTLEVRGDNTPLCRALRQCAQKYIPVFHRLVDTLPALRRLKDV